MLPKKLKLLIALAVVWQMAVPASLLAAVGQFTSLTGNITQMRGGKAVKPLLRSAIELKDLIITADKSSAMMVFNDGSTITLSSNSRFEVRDFSIGDNVRKGWFSLALGKLAANVRNFIGNSSTFEVHTPTAIAGVRGTEFEVTVSLVEDQLRTTVSCQAGALSVSALSTAGTVVSTTGIVAGQTAIVTSTGISVSATAAGVTGAAEAAGAAAGAAASASITTGTIMGGAAVAAAAAAAIAASTGSDTTVLHQSTAVHH